MNAAAEPGPGSISEFRSRSTHYPHYDQPAGLETRGARHKVGFCLRLPPTHLKFPVNCKAVGTRKGRLYGPGGKKCEERRNTVRRKVCSWERASFFVARFSGLVWLPPASAGGRNWPVAMFARLSALLVLGFSHAARQNG